jgi:hypothetical protein
MTSATSSTKTSIADTISAIHSTLRVYNENLTKTSDVEPGSTEQKVDAAVSALKSLQSHLVDYSDDVRRREDLGIQYVVMISAKISDKQFERAWDLLNEDDAIIKWKTEFGHYRDSSNH